MELAVTVAYVINWVVSVTASQTLSDVAVTDVLPAPTALVHLAAKPVTVVVLGHLITFVIYKLVSDTGKIPFYRFVFWYHMISGC